MTYKSNSALTKDTHILPSQGSYVVFIVVSIVRIVEKTDSVITTLHCNNSPVRAIFVDSLESSQCALSSVIVIADLYALLHHRHWNIWGLIQYKDVFLPVSKTYPDTKVHVANMGHTWGWEDPGGPHVGPINFAIRVIIDIRWM